MTAVAIETSVLESLDFEIGCQSVEVGFLTRKQISACCKTATHIASIHQLTNCSWVEKFLCDAHTKEYRDGCWGCSTQPRIKDCKHIGGAS